MLLPHVRSERMRFISHCLLISFSLFALPNPVTPPTCLAMGVQFVPLKAVGRKFPKSFPEVSLMALFFFWFFTFPFAFDSSWIAISYPHCNAAVCHSQCPIPITPCPSLHFLVPAISWEADTIRPLRGPPVFLLPSLSVPSSRSLKWDRLLMPHPPSPRSSSSKSWFFVY